MSSGVVVVPQSPEESPKTMFPCDVTIFGFDSSRLSLVLREFAQCGEILEHRWEDGNWVHIRYVSRDGAQRALERHGAMIDRQTMVAVMATEQFYQQHGRCWSKDERDDKPCAHPSVLGVNQPLVIKAKVNVDAKNSTFDFRQ